MDDPWAAPSWSTPAKPSSSIDKPFSFSPTRSPDGFGSNAVGGDDADPWGAQATQSSLPVRRKSSPKRGSPNASTAETPGWGGENAWGQTGSGFADPPRSRSPELGQPSWSPPAFKAADEHDDGGRDVSRSQTPRSNRSSPRPATPPRFPSPPPLDLPVTSPPSRNITPAIIHSDADEDPEAAFAAALPRQAVDEMPRFETAIPKSPDFGDFGGFQEQGVTSDFWGGKAAADAADNTNDGWGRSGEQDEVDDAHGGWAVEGDRHVAASREESSGMDIDWQEAQRRLKLKETLAEQVNDLQNRWKQLAVEAESRRVYPGSKLAEDPEALAAASVKSQADSAETLRSLAIIPSTVNTYAPVLSGLETYKSYQTTIARPNPSPSASVLLSTLTASRRPRRPELALGSQVKAEPWLARSRLGEPEQPSTEAARDDGDDKKGKWSFWGRKQEPKPLVTSGGAILEAKSASTASTPLATPLERPSLSERQPSVSVSSNRASRTSSPAPTGLFDEPMESPSAVKASTAVDSPIDITSTPVTPSAQTAQPSAVTRFFGRFGRRASSQPQTIDTDANDPKDLELADDDFSFLAEVPSLAPVDKTQGDLLGMESGRSEAIASLESMISSKPVALPPALAPPPPGRHQAPVYSRTASSASTRAPPKQASDMDLLSGLFDESSISSPPPAGASQSTSGSGWDDFMAPTKLASPISVPPQPRSVTPRISAPPVPIQTSPPPPTVPNKSPPRPYHPSSTFSDLDDFGTPHVADTSTMPSNSGDFDDFGDFSDFASPPPPAQPAAQANPSTGNESAHQSAFDMFLSPPTTTTARPSHQPHQIPTPPGSGQGHTPRRSLDHTPTLNLLDNVNASKGKRWPAPPSPDVPMFVPPPKHVGANAPAQYGGSSSLAFLSPPPPGRPASGLGNRGTMNADFFGISETPASRQSATVPSTSGTTKPDTTYKQPSNQGGLSSQDLSFFDSL